MWSLGVSFIAVICLVSLMNAGGATLAAAAAAAAATVTAADQSPMMVPRVCEPIRIELCRGIGYNETSMPNLVGHELQTDTDLTVQTFSPLIQYGCSAQLQFFLCAAYVPMCTTKVPVPIGPCRGLCETVRARCHPVLQGFGFPWPAALDCSRFPKENNHEHMCMEGPGEPGGGGGIVSGGNGGGGGGNGGGMSSAPTSKISTHQLSCQGLTNAHLYVRLARSNRCAPLCEADILFDQHEKNVAEMWVTAWSVAALFTAIIASLCLIFADSHADNILMPLVTCHLMVTIGWVVRWFAGRNPTACGIDPQLPGISLLLTDGLSNAPCATTFLMRYYFGMAANVWWAILCLKYVRQVRSLTQSDNTITPVVDIKNNNHSKDNAYNSLAQLAAWGVPALQTIGVLVGRVVDADELLGTCFVGNQSDKALRLLVAIPLFGYWIFAAVNLLAGYLIRQRTNPAVLKNLNLNGMGTFLFVYFVPSGILLFTVFYDFVNRDLWLNLPQPSLEPMAATKAPMWPFMVRAFLELLLGVIAAAWTIGPRIAGVCKNRFGPKYKQQPQKFVPPVYSTASYQTVCAPPPNSMVSLPRIPRHGRKYPPAAHVAGRKARTYKSSSQSMSLTTGNETVL